MQLEAGTICSQVQDHSLATLAPILKREDGWIDFSRTAQQIYDRWRGFQPWPGAHTPLRGKKLIVQRMHVGVRKRRLREGVLEVRGRAVCWWGVGAEGCGVDRGADGREAADECGGVSAGVSGEQRRTVGAMKDASRRRAVKSR